MMNFLFAHTISNRMIIILVCRINDNQLNDINTKSTENRESCE